MNIRCFTRGDLITRTERTRNHNDGSYIGDSFFFSHIANGMIYLTVCQTKYYFQGKGQSQTLDAQEFADGWAYYEDPARNLYSLNTAVNRAESVLAQLDSFRRRLNAEEAELAKERAELQKSLEDVRYLKATYKFLCELLDWRLRWW